MPLSELKARPILDRISIVLRPTEGGSLEQIAQYVQLGAPVAIGRAGAVIAAASDEDFHVTISREREQHAEQVDLLQAALAVDPLLTACAPEMFSLLERIEVKCGGLNAVLGHGMEPSEQMWEDSQQALDDVWPLLCKVQGKEYAPDPVGTEQVNQIAREVENVNQQQTASQNIPENIPAFNIDEHVRMAADARRYRWLRDVAFDTPRQDLVPRDRHQNMLIEQDLDSEIDRAMKAYSSELEAEPCEQ